MPKQKRTVDEYIQLCKENNQYWMDHFTVIQYERTDKEVTVKCNIHPDIQISIAQAARLYKPRAKVCSECAIIVDDKTNKYIQKHKAEWAGKGGENYIYDNTVFRDNVDVITFNCIEHGDCTINKYKYNGCNQCFQIRNKYNNTRTENTEIFIKKAYLSRRITNPEESIFDYSKVDYKRSKDEVIIICKLCDTEFLQTPSSHLSGAGCNKCFIVKNKSGVYTRKTLEHFVYEANCIHLGAFSYDKVSYINNKTYILIKCNTCENYFECLPTNHLAGYGCKYCGGSKGEKIISYLLTIFGISYIREKKFDDLRDVQYLRYDFYISEYNLLIEYDGKQHFEPIKHFGGVDAYNKTVEHDNIKNKYAEDNYYCLLRIKYTDDIKNVLIRELKNITGSSVIYTDEKMNKFDVLMENSQNVSDSMIIEEIEE